MDHSFLTFMDQGLLTFVAVGFLAQMVDGALGMAYGVTSTTFLLSLGVPPASASAAVHTAEVFTTGVSGFTHLKLGNVDKRLLTGLLLPGVVGGVLGAYVVTSVPEEAIKPVVTAYLLVMGCLILWKAFRTIEKRKVTSKLVPLGFAGGFLDAIGGGGWGPIVTSTLVARGNEPRYTVGSVNATEFFVTVAQVATFSAVLGLSHWNVIVGLLVGGVVAAPLAAHLCRVLPTRVLMGGVGVLIIATSMRTILLSL